MPVLMVGRFCWAGRFSPGPSKRKKSLRQRHFSTSSKDFECPSNSFPGTSARFKTSLCRDGFLSVILRRLTYAVGKLRSSFEQFRYQRFE